MASAKLAENNKKNVCVMFMQTHITFYNVDYQNVLRHILPCKTDEVKNATECPTDTKPQHLATSLIPNKSTRATEKHVILPPTTWHDTYSELLFYMGKQQTIE